MQTLTQISHAAAKPRATAPRIRGRKRCLANDGNRKIGRVVRYKVNREKGRGFVIRYYPQDGARHSHRIDTDAVPPDASQETAEHYAASWIADHVTSSGTKPRRQPVAFGPTFEAFATEWCSGALATRYPDHVRRKASACADEARLKKYVLPLIGKKPLAAFEGEQGLDL
jgi:hypothetical protein